MNRYDIEDFVLCTLYILCGLVVLFLIGLNIYAFIEYGNKPMSEVPAWIWWLWFGGKN